MSNAERRAKQIKAALSALIRNAARDKESKEKLAEYIGKSFHAVEAMAYQQKGSFDAWVNAVLFLFDIDSELAVKGLKELRHLAKKTHPLSESDRIWFEEIDKMFSEDDKIYWLNLMRCAAKLRRQGK